MTLNRKKFSQFRTRNTTAIFYVDGKKFVEDFVFERCVCDNTASLLTYKEINTNYPNAKIERIINEL